MTNLDAKIIIGIPLLFIIIGLYFVIAECFRRCRYYDKWGTPCKSWGKFAVATSVGGAIVLFIGYFILLITAQFVLREYLSENKMNFTELRSELIQRASFGSKSDADFKKNVASFIQIEENSQVKCKWGKLRKLVYRHNTEFTDDFFNTAKRLVDIAERNEKKLTHDIGEENIIKTLKTGFLLQQEMNNIFIKDPMFIKFFDEIKEIQKDNRDE